jgi:predicted permease
MVSELKVAARTLRAHPLFTSVAVTTLAIGIGANAAIFSVVNAVLLRPLPFPESHRLVSVYSRYLPSSGYDFPYFALSGPEFEDVRDRIDAFEAVAAYDLVFRNVSRSAGEAQRVLTMPVTSAFFGVLGVRPAQGRTFTEDETQRPAACLVVLGDDLATPFGAGVGSTIRLDAVPCEVIGIMPAGFGFRDDRVRAWTTLAVEVEETPTNRASHPLLAVARVREGVGPAQAESQLETLRRHWSATHPDHYATGHFAVIRPLQEDLVGDQRQGLVLLGGAVVAVLLIVCVNLAALLVSRGEARRREFAVRHALGANRRRLVRQLVVESMLLAAAGGVLGLLFANWLLAGLLALYPQRLPVWRVIAVDHAAALFTLALVIAAALLVGLVPALQVTGIGLLETLKADPRASTPSRRGVVARSALVIGQLAVSVVLLAGAILLIRSYQHLQRVDLGIDPESVLTFGLSVPPGRQPDPAAARRMIGAIEARLSSAAGVEAAGAISNLPLQSAGPPDDFVIEGRPPQPPGSPAWNARYLMTTPGTFEALRIRVKRGRLLSERDVAGQPLVALINETAARLYWPDDDPVGRAIRYFPQETGPSIRIVGIVADVRSLGANRPAPPTVYVPFGQAPRDAYEGRSMTFVVRVRGNPTDAAGSARAAVAAIDAGLPLANVRPMTAVVAAAAGQPRFTMLVMSFFAGVAFLLGGLGLYGIVAYTVEQRVREIGIRMALGADSHEIVRLVVRNGTGLAAAGIGIGIPAALAATRAMTGLLSGVTSTDLETYLAVVVMLAGSALLASYLPARRATRVDPLVALRTE